MKKKIKFLQFYIGNVCNLACPNCASFNNYAFKGQFDWFSNKENAHLWSKILDPNEVAIIGGEPFTNPDLDNWVYGLLESYTPNDFRITTNGTFLKRDIERVLDYTSKGVNIEISSHSKSHYAEHNLFIKKYFPNKEILDDCIKYTNSNKGFIEVRDATNFFNICVKGIEDKTFIMNNSNPKDAHDVCPVKDCHYIVEGKLYQCVVTATTPMFAQQFKVDEHSKQIINQTKSVLPTDSNSAINMFLDKIDKPCIQCTLCPDTIELNNFTLPRKKVKI